MKKLIFLPIFILMSGCARFYTGTQDTLSLYSISSLPSEQKINKAAGINRLTDNRPTNEKDRLPYAGKKERAASSLDRITFLLVEDIKKSRLFKETHYPAQPTDDIIINGSINRMDWHTKQTSWGEYYNSLVGQLLTVLFLPSRLPSLLGAPEKQEYCTADISIVVKDSKTGVVIGEFSASSQADALIRNPYGPVDGHSAAIAFSNVVNELKKDMITKIQDYYNIK